MELLKIYKKHNVNDFSEPAVFLGLRVGLKRYTSMTPQMSYTQVKYLRMIVKCTVFDIRRVNYHLSLQGPLLHYCLV
jgi:hypothetical protein